LVFDIFRAMVHRFDGLLRRQKRVQEFTQDEGCILRIALTVYKRDTRLSDGTEVRSGQRICELHLWNERLPPMPREGPDLRWGVRFYRLVVKSLRGLAIYLAAEQELEDIVALRGEMALPGGGDVLASASVGSQVGFDVLNVTLQAGRWGRFKHFWENVYAWALMWTFNPGTLRAKSFLRLQRYQFWMSRQELLRRYGK
jgi:hypothetical protein